MKLTFDYNNQIIHYTLIYKKRNVISINITDDGEVQVLAPVGCSVYSVMDKVKGHAPWIIAECQKKKNPPNTEDDQTQQEATCTYLGKNYKVKVIQNEDKEVPTVKLVRGKLEIEMKDVTQEGMITALQGWYTKKILDKVKEKQKIFQSYFKRMPQQIDISAIGKQLYILEGDTLHIHGVVAKGPIQVLEYIMVLAFCEYNKMLLTDTSLAPLLEGEEQAKVWLSLNGYV